MMGGNRVSYKAGATLEGHVLTEQTIVQHRYQSNAVT